LTMLLNEGFQYKRYVHIFDAGPTIEAPFSAIRSIAGSSTLKIASISESLQASHCLIANNGLDFRAIVQVAKIDPVQNSCTITQEAADLLKVGIGDNLRVMPLD
jgi:arginine N-succinyltransferase